MLVVKNISVFYDGIHALRDVSFTVPEGQIVSLIGANGAGKTTALRSIVGLVKIAFGSICWDDQAIDVLDTRCIVSKGIAMVPEGRRIFPNLTVEENLLLGAYSRKDKIEIKKDKELIFEYFPRLKERQKQSAGTLSGGEQQMLALGRGLMTKPKLFMLDEPSLGLAPLIVKMIFEIITEINSRGTTILLVEQNAKAALEIADYGYVLETGVVSFSGTGKELLDDDRVRKAYLGEN